MSLHNFWFEFGHQVAVCSFMGLILKSTLDIHSKHFSNLRLLCSVVYMIIMHMTYKPYAFISNVNMHYNHYCR